LQYKEPIKLGGVGNVSTESSDGVYTVQLPTFNGERAMLIGVAIHKAMTSMTSIGELVAILLIYQFFQVGIKYLRYHLKPIFQPPSGLTIYESIFKNPDGSRGVIGGTHHVFTTIQKQFNRIGKCNQLNIFKSGFQVNPDVPLLCTKS